MAQNESATSVEQIYPTQGVFIKLSAADNVPMNLSSNTKRSRAPSFINLSSLQDTTKDTNASPGLMATGSGKGRGMLSSR